MHHWLMFVFMAVSMIALGLWTSTMMCGDLFSVDTNIKNRTESAEIHNVHMDNKSLQI